MAGRTCRPVWLLLWLRLLLVLYGRRWGWAVLLLVLVYSGHGADRLGTVADAADRYGRS
jgi:hypothetical protein